MTCQLYKTESPKYILLQPVDEHDLNVLDKEVELIAKVQDSFALVAFKVNDWNADLSPWVHEPVFGKVPFAGNAKETLSFIEKDLLLFLKEQYNWIPDEQIFIIGGYSLAGLFLLWASYESGLFKGVVAASPSVWFMGWMEYVKTHIIQVESIYLSLGNKEEKVQNPIMATVGKNIQNYADLLVQSFNKSGKTINCIFEWNEGNHFRDFEIRTSKAFNWCMSSVIEKH